MSTERQKKVAEKLVENGRTDKIKNKGEIIRESEYSEASATKPSRIINSKGVQAELKPFLIKLEAERDRLLEAISAKNISTVEYEKCVNSFDKIVKNIELLSGRPTENLNNPYENEHLRKIADRIRGRSGDGEPDG